MSAKPWHLSRRTFLRGAGVACALPWLEAMAQDTAGAPRPRRMGFVYWPNGCSLPPADGPYAHWRWFPDGEGRDFRFTRVLESLEPFRERLSVIGGLSHPKSRPLLGHLAGDLWLTGGDARGGQYKNSISVDQVAASHLVQHTRYPFLALSCDGGVGYKSRVSTLSFDVNGHPIPTECRPREIFERYFAPDGGATTEERRAGLQRGRKIVDLVLADSRALRGRLGATDRAKLERYMDSLNAVEAQVRRNERWLDTPLPHVDPSALDLSAQANVDPTAYLRTMFDLMVLAYETDLTRVITFMMAREDGMGFGDNFPKLALGIPKGHHTITHDTEEGHWDEWGRYDQWFAQQFAYFVGRMAEVEDAHGPLLDGTMLLYGSACSTTHNANDLPLVLAGGSGLGLRHGRFTVYDAKLPLSNLFVRLLQVVGVETDTFSDSTGALEGLLV